LIKKIHKYKTILYEESSHNQGYKLYNLQTKKLTISKDDKVGENDFRIGKKKNL